MAGILLVAIVSTICFRSPRSKVSDARSTASGAACVMLRSAPSTSWLLRTSKASKAMESLSPALRAVSKLMRLRRLRLFPNTTTRDRCGTTSLSSSRRFSSRSTLSAMNPVIFPPGRARLETRPVLSASPMPPHHDRNLRGCFFRRERGRCPPSHDHVHGQRNQFGREVGIAFLTALGEAIFNDKVPALEVAHLLQRLAKPLDRRKPQIRHKSDPADARRLLRARCERPRGHAAEQRHELAPLYRCNHSITSSALACKVSGTTRPSALAVFKLTTSSNLVGCMTGISAGRAPLRI